MDNEKYKLEKRIEYLSQLQETSKFNYNIKLSGFYQNVIILATGLLTIFTWIITSNIGNDIKIIVADIILILYFLWADYMHSKTTKDIKRISGNFNERENSIKELYKKLGIDISLK